MKYERTREIEGERKRDRRLRTEEQRHSPNIHDSSMQKTYCGTCRWGFLPINSGKNTTPVGLETPITLYNCT